MRKILCHRVSSEDAGVLESCGEEREGREGDGKGREGGEEGKMRKRRRRTEVRRWQKK